jgi:hypothetical protein
MGGGREREKRLKRSPGSGGRKAEESWWKGLVVPFNSVKTAGVVHGGGLVTAMVRKEKSMLSEKGRRTMVSETDLAA